LQPKFTLTGRVESKAISVTTKRFEPVEEIKRDSSIPIHLIPLYSPAASNPRCSSASSIPSARRPPLSPMLAGRAPLSPIDSLADAARPRLHSRCRAQTLAAPLPAAVEETPASFSPCCRCLPPTFYCGRRQGAQRQLPRCGAESAAAGCRGRRPHPPAMVSNYSDPLSFFVSKTSISSRQDTAVGRPRHGADGICCSLPPSFARIILQTKRGRISRFISSTFSAAGPATAT
jgi:hypothetical protein